MSAYQPFRARFRDERQFRLFILLCIATALNTWLIFARLVLVHFKTHPGEPFSWPEIQGVFGLAFGFLGWNLFLAWIPYLAALRFERARRTGVSRAAILGWFAGWLVFLPNAPYLITDFIHLQYRPPIPVWYDMVMLFSFACTGLMLGLLSLYEIRQGLRLSLSAWRSESIVLGSIGLAGFGVWLGRFQRWNSWDVLANPGGLLHDLATTLRQRHELIDAFGVSALIGSILLVGYVMLTVMLANRQS